MANQTTGRAPSLMRLVFVLLAMGACLTVVILLLGVPLNAELVSFCFDSFEFFGGDYRALADCLDFAAETTVTETPEVQIPVEQHVVIDGPLFSCNESDLMVSFVFNQPATGEFELDWGAVPTGGNQSVSIQDSSVVSFRPDLHDEDGTYNILSIVLSDGSGTIYDDTEIRQVETCSTQMGEVPPSPTSTPNPDGTPTIINSVCVGSGPSKQLMVVFEFEQDVLGEYAALVAEIPYQHSPVGDYPHRLYYFGTPPPQGPITIQLVSIPDLAIAFEETYIPVVCGPREDSDDDDDDDGGYTPPGS